jgi:hypothetical protein
LPGGFVAPGFHHELRIELDDVFRHAGRRHHAGVPHQCQSALLGTEFEEGRHIRKLQQTVSSLDRDRLGLAHVDDVLRARSAADRRMHRTAGEIGPHRRTAPIMHRREGDAVFPLNRGNAEVRKRASAIGADVGRVLLREVDELLQRRRAGRVVHHQRQTGDRACTDRLEILRVIVRQALVKHLLRHQRRRNDVHQRVAVRRRILQLRRGDDAVGTGLVVRHNGLAELLRHVLGEHATHLIGAAASAIADDHANRLRRAPLLRDGRRADKRRGGRSRSGGKNLTTGETARHGVVLPWSCFLFVTTACDQLRPRQRRCDGFRKHLSSSKQHPRHVTHTCHDAERTCTITIAVRQRKPGARWVRHPVTAYKRARSHSASGHGAI